MVTKFLIYTIHVDPTTILADYSSLAIEVAYLALHQTSKFYPLFYTFGVEIEMVVRIRLAAGGLGVETVDEDMQECNTAVSFCNLVNEQSCSRVTNDDQPASGLFQDSRSLCTIKFRSTPARSTMLRCTTGSRRASVLYRFATSAALTGSRSGWSTSLMFVRAVLCQLIPTASILPSFCA